MLLLAQNSREIIYLETSDGTIELRVTRLNGDEARIGVEVPQSVRIIRHEIKQPPSETTPDTSAKPAESEQSSQPSGSSEQVVASAPIEAEQDEDTEDPWWLHPSEQGSQSDGENDTASMLTGLPMVAAPEEN